MNKLFRQPGVKDKRMVHGGTTNPGITVQEIYQWQAGEKNADPSDTLLHDPIEYRSVFLSDTHLGAPGSCASDVVQFLNHIKPEYIYWVGDLFDLWHLRIFNPFRIGKLLEKGVFTSAEGTVLQKINRADRHGVKQIYIPGNHDEVVRDFTNKRDPFMNNILILFDAVHETADGRRFLVMHGDSFDALVRDYRWLGILGTRVFGSLAKLSIQIDKWRKGARVNRLFEYLGLDRHWSLAHAIRTKSDGAAYNASYKQAMLAYLFKKNADICKRKEPPLDGIICGHTHVVDECRFPSPLDKESGGSVGPLEVTYFNTGHWTGRPTGDGDLASDEWRNNLKHPACTALVEHRNGNMELVQWVPGKGILPLARMKTEGLVSDNKITETPGLPFRPSFAGREKSPIAARVIS